MIPLKKHLAQYIETHRSEFINRWEKKVIIPDGEDSIEIIRGNGEKMVELLVHLLTFPQENIEESIKPFAKKVAEERLKVNINIGEFVYNVDIARSEIYKDLNKLTNDVTEIQEALDHFNLIFDRFLYYAVSHYTELKNSIIRQKEEYISTTHDDRLSLLGQMTSSFVHEFRNPLTSIHGFIQLLKAEHQNLPYLEIISGELDQLKFRITQFLMLSKKQIVDTEWANLSMNDLLDEVMSFLYPRIVEVNVRIEEDLQPGLHFSGYKEEIRQVFINIIFNAVEVLSDQHDDPVILLRAYEQNGSIVVSIKNNGPQIPLEHQATIFDPFFTTKKTGTGLGLYICKEIIEKHGGSLTCESAQDWTVFSISLPST
ncbi:histidine kinase N-terminal domain-containing protein [Falsibacillus pallidus]|uniref:histidine kinase N-terminal domain-containing protein n=1 Tax=Falsibacillus pallidus TaxID=493781 RepID=UPI003D95C8C6